MLKKRVIPVLFLMDGKIVRSERFNDFKVIGDPYTELSRFSEWLADELVYVDISRKPDFNQTFKILQKISEYAFMPLTFGGNIRTLEQIGQIIRGGADKVIINTGAAMDLGLIPRAAEKFGSQAIVAGIDNLNGRAMIHHGQVDIGFTLEWAKTLICWGAGEIFLNSVERDGTGMGYDLETIKAVSRAVKVPVVACGGVGQLKHFKEGFDVGADAVAAGNFFHFTENAYPRTKKYLHENRVSVRHEE
ncbi:MAG: hypothetical protein A3F68_08160 [Acidobacteria bacterium RIFCSPLOWO2_12_FULL_54_10]|nr:MAG: hypothetical protein A3F68_08160 [Acidobacteria bacterium RIFCSPLOWO2_12_FULL_54_10]